MALLIALELGVMLVTMQLMSSVRAFIAGEGLWSKAQKDAIHSLSQYALTGDRENYLQFQEHLKIPFGDRLARLELAKPDPDLLIVETGFRQGAIPAAEIPGLIRLLRFFHNVSYIRQALEAWTAADLLLDRVVLLGRELDEAIQAQQGPERMRAIMAQVGALNRELTVQETRFSQVLGDGSRELEDLLKLLLGLAVLLVGGLSLYLTFSFSRSLGRHFNEVTRIAGNVGRGDFSESVPVTSGDELGQLGMAINRMMLNLNEHIGNRRKAESANQTKSLFLANMSHEIRTPLGVILGFTEALKQPNLEREDQQKFVETIERTGQDLRRIINDILDISKVEAGHLDIDKVAFDFVEFIQDLEMAMQIQARQNDNQLDFIPVGDLPREVVTDNIRLKQILVNVLGNALKFTRKGQVQVRYGLRGEHLYFEVNDNGIGMSPDDVAQLFQPFSQADSSTTRRFGGTGLGLSLSRRLARALGGDIILLESVVGKGTSFRITVAATSNSSERRVIERKSSVPKAVDLSEGMAGLRGRRILLVDDSGDNQTLLQFLMQKWGMDYDSATNGREAVEKAMTRPFDLILMDMQMPVMDGYEATKTLRRLNFLKPIVALTAHAMKEDRNRCLAVGCNDYLSKPIDHNILLQTLCVLLIQPEVSSPEA